MKVEILSSKVIKPSIPTPVHLRKHKISFFDQLTKEIHTGTIFFFPSNSMSSTLSHNETTEKCDQLEKSLSETLTRYYPLAGMYIKEDFVVDCNDEGVELSRAKVNGQLAEITRGRTETELLDAFLPNPLDLARLVPLPVLAIHINMFDCGGIAIGIRILHNIGDGASVCAFVKEWATRNQSIGVNNNQEPVCNPSFELGSLFPARELVGLKPVLPGEFTANKKLITKSFLFDGATISALKAEAMASGSELKPSRVQVVTAHIWKTLIQMSQAKHGHLRSSLMSFAMSLRGRIRFNISENSFGTLVSHTTVQYKADESSMELNALTGLIRNAITKTSDNYAKARHGDEIYSMLIDYYNEIGGDKPAEVDLCRFTSWCGFPYYEIDFGWGKPSWVATPSKFVEIVFLFDTKCGGGIEAWVTLYEDDMIEFECRYQHKSLGTNALYQQRSLRSAM